MPRRPVPGPAGHRSAARVPAREVAITRAGRAETALDAERAERRALTDRLTAVPAQARTRNRTAVRLPAPPAA
ncbi:MAG: hypothetical protein ACRDNW_02475 [Trebonia sp.]